MKQGDEALNASSLQFLTSVLNAASLQFFLSVKCFITVIFYRKPSFNASSPLLFKKKVIANTLTLLLLNVTLPTSAYQKPNLSDIEPD
jgi:hypothetical protein